MYRVGDKIVCIDNKLAEHFLILGNVYTITDIKECFVYIKDNDNIMWFDIYFLNKFISLKEFRKRKLNRICIM